MSLVSRWDIRTESYADAASVTLLTDRAGTTNLDQNYGTAWPTYSAAENAISFDGVDDTIGSVTLSSALANTPLASFSIFALVKTATRSDNYYAGFGNSADGQQAVYLRDASASTARAFLRDAAGTIDEEFSSTTYPDNTWTVLHLCCDGANIKIGHSGSNVVTQVLNASLATNGWDQFGLGCYWRASLTNHITTLMREVRVYNSDESSNLASIVSSMQGAGSSSIAPILSTSSYGSSSSLSSRG